MIKSLPQKGVIHFDSNTNYWYIKLSQEWQNQSSNIVSLSLKYCLDTNQYLNAIDLCNTWSMMIYNGKNGKDRNKFTSNQKNMGHPIIDCITPPSIAGL